MTGALMELYTVDVPTRWGCPDGTLGRKALCKLSASQPAYKQKRHAKMPTGPCHEQSFLGL